MEMLPNTSDRRTIKMEMNRVEGDLDIKLEVEGHTVVDAWCIGTMYREFEQILVGRAPADVLVIAPRICGICSTAQLYAATAALEMAYQAPIAPNGTRIRNLCLMVESVMGDPRHTFLMFAPDFYNEAYRHHGLYDQVMKLFEPPFKGRIARERGGVAEDGAPHRLEALLLASGRTAVTWRESHSRALTPVTPGNPIHNAIKQSWAPSVLMASGLGGR
jgi:Nickel-dependent hydrogenase